MLIIFLMADQTNVYYKKNRLTLLKSYDHEEKNEDKFKWDTIIKSTLMFFALILPFLVILSTFVIINLSIVIMELHSCRKTIQRIIARIRILNNGGKQLKLLNKSVAVRLKQRIMNVIPSILAPLNIYSVTQLIDIKLADLKTKKERRVAYILRFIILGVFTMLCCDAAFNYAKSNTERFYKINFIVGIVIIALTFITRQIIKESKMASINNIILKKTRRFNSPIYIFFGTTLLFIIWTALFFKIIYPYISLSKYLQSVFSTVLLYK